MLFPASISRTSLVDVRKINYDLQHIARIVCEIFKGLRRIVEPVGVGDDLLKRRLACVDNVDQLKEILLQRVSGTVDVQFLLLDQGKVEVQVLLADADQHHAAAEACRVNAVLERGRKTYCLDCHVKPVSVRDLIDPGLEILRAVVQDGPVQTEVQILREVQLALGDVAHIDHSALCLCCD